MRKNRVPARTLPGSEFTPEAWDRPDLVMDFPHCAPVNCSHDMGQREGSPLNLNLNHGRRVHIIKKDHSARNNPEARGPPGVPKPPFRDKQERRRVKESDSPVLLLWLAKNLSRASDVEFQKPVHHGAFADQV